MSRPHITVTACFLAAVACLSAVAPGSASARQPRQAAHRQAPEPILVPVQMGGQLTVQFHGDSADGCARRGLCGYSGTVTWHPPSSATLLVLRGAGAHPRTAIDFLTSAFLGSASGVTTANVTLAGDAPGSTTARCGDAVNNNGSTEFAVQDGRVTVSLRRITPSLLATRCAGPRDADILPLLPEPNVALAALEHQGETISLAAAATLNAQGFSGVVTSSLRLRIGRASSLNLGSDDGGSGGVRMREIDVDYRATVSGSVQEEVQGATNPLVCDPLGSCGLRGTVTLTPRARHVAVDLSADEPASRPTRNLLAAAGLAPGSSHGVTAGGFGDWISGGAVRSDVTQGTEQCQDAAPLGIGTLLFSSSAGRLGVAYNPGPLLGATIVATDCPGPQAGGITPAAGHTAIAALRPRTSRISLTTGAKAFDDGYVVRYVPHLTVTLTRERVKLRIIRLPNDL
jgi:hypothetical protein